MEKQEGLAQQVGYVHDGRLKGQSGTPHGGGPADGISRAGL